MNNVKERYCYKKTLDKAVHTVGKSTCRVGWYEGNKYLSFDGTDWTEREWTSKRVGGIGGIGM